ncbi:lipocalin family protein [Niabella beijingensis]|uniref:lipocalin family protein n=1 Tax=Niabella beijingensis TaxID=2872700 RepID=UPI001CBFCE97|nr:lipocalin family protein [Niabella beijingensis]MBZ4191288.1 lipocalin family protein [Niabella beijingensis]
MRKKQLIRGVGLLTAGAAVIAIARRRTIPKGVTAVTDFDKDRYLGIWYEIARLDFRYEEDLSYVRAEYSLRYDGTLRVVNRGFDHRRHRWQQSIGRAKFVNNERTGQLSVSFFGPFYTGYNVIAIDEDYRYALVCGKNRNYLWLLSRKKTLPRHIEERYLRRARELGFDVDRLTWTEQV